jgi:threonine/homoserine/homoserine lactone efflux protein
VIPDATRLGFFVVAALALLLVPGPAVLYVVARSIQQGRRAGLASVLGIHVGTLVHIAAATVGLSALVVSSAVAFTAVKIAGAVYLVGLGLWTLLSRRAEPEVALGGAPNMRRAFAQGIVVNVLNPKTALFFLAFLPQFVDPNASHPAVQIALLGLLFAALGLVTDSLWALAAGTAGGVLRRSRRFVRGQRYVTGTVYVGLGLATAFAGSADEGRACPAPTNGA